MKKIALAIIFGIHAFGSNGWTNETSGAPRQVIQSSVRDQINLDAYRRAMTRCEDIQPGYVLAVGKGLLAVALGGLAYLNKDAGTVGNYAPWISAAWVSITGAAVTAFLASNDIFMILDINGTKELMSDLITHGEESLAARTLIESCKRRLGDKCNPSLIFENIARAINEDVICQSTVKKPTYYNYVISPETGSTKY